MPGKALRLTDHSDRRAVYARAALAFACILPLALTLACGGSGGGSSPTAPAMPTAAGTASLQGQVTVTGQTGGSSLSSGASAASGPRVSGPARSGGAQGSSSVSSFAAADSSGAGVTVRIAGTSLSTMSAANGSFNLSGVPEGNINVLFETASSTATVGIDGVQPNESIRLDVTVSGSNASVDNLERSGDDGMDDGGGDGTDPAELELELEISPDDWNLNYDHASGTVEAFIRGTGYRDVVLGSIVLEGDNGDAMPLDPVSATRQGDHVRARFAKNRVLDLLEDPQPGSMHTVTVTFEVDGQMDPVSLDDDITIEEDDAGDDPNDDGGGDGEDGEDDQVGNLELQISPDSWNTNYDGANGSVTAFVRGDGLSAIDTDSLELSGDNSEADPLPASFARLEGEHVRAQFPKSQVLGLLDEPTSGSEHTVTLHLTANDGADEFDLEAEVKIVGKDK